MNGHISLVATFVHYISGSNLQGIRYKCFLVGLSEAGDFGSSLELRSFISAEELDLGGVVERGSNPKSPHTDPGEPLWAGRDSHTGSAGQCPAWQ